MSIWEYKKSNYTPREEWINVNNCVFCNTGMHILREKDADDWIGHGTVKVCLNCGWWNIYTHHEEISAGHYMSFTRGNHSFLKELDLENIETPIQEIREYLIAKYDSRFSINPCKYEEVVASVLKDLGYEVQVTSYHNDGGIDVILNGSTEKTIGVQVKRYKNRIQVNQIREFTGALVIGGFTRGIFVTTSQFQTGCQSSATRSSDAGYPIELIDAEKFYDSLKIAKRPSIKTYEEWEEMVGRVPPLVSIKSIIE